MFAVIFEVQPKAERWDDYLQQAGLLRPELVRVDGFIANERYKSLHRPGWVLSLSIWRDEKAVVRWRTVAMHHAAQEKGRFEVFADYHLRVGEVTADTGLPPGQTLACQRLDETETGAAKHIVLTERTLPGAAPLEIATRLGLASSAQSGLTDSDVFRHLQREDDYLLLSSWKDAAAADAWLGHIGDRERRHRRVRVIRDYGMFDRREAPQYYPAVSRP